MNSHEYVCPCNDASLQPPFLTLAVPPSSPETLHIPVNELSFRCNADGTLSITTSPPPCYLSYSLPVACNVVSLSVWEGGPIAFLSFPKNIIALKYVDTSLLSQQTLNFVVRVAAFAVHVGRSLWYIGSGRHCGCGWSICILESIEKWRCASCCFV
jgi:hypothetical protein